PSLFSFIEEEFKKFLNQHITDPKAEFLIPLTADQFIRSKKGVIKVLPTNAQWFGVTYKEDASVVTGNINKLVEEGAYPNKLWPQTASSL
ncbi:MAG: nucleotidyltransferase, partial [Gloeobacteraceae cyanobacterium ES-bin-316]|nr:nucleotidyltransferase [Ferruginibacter sp.]